ncbi:hypothetical protein [Candidatus Protochlamydia phocaeensis]|nr:hypothetical protein [Candidatus Protochlamydia phocaeensis]
MALQAADCLTQDFVARLSYPAIGQNKGGRYLLRVGLSTDL